MSGGMIAVEIEAATTRPARSFIVPERPLVVVGRSSSWALVDLRELWRSRGLLYFLIWRDVKVRYKQTALGAAWAIAQPLCMMAIFTVFFGRLAGVPSDGIPYPVFAYSGLLIWTFFSQAVTASSNSLLANAHLITKVYFPRVLIPAAAISTGLLDFAIAFVLLVPVLPFFAGRITWRLLLLPIPLLLAALLAFGIGMYLSALNVRYRDVRHAVPFAVQVWMFASPVIYPLSFVPDGKRWLAQLNPVSGIVETFRACLFGRELPTEALFVSIAATFVIAIVAGVFFRRMEQCVADLI